MCKQQEGLMKIRLSSSIVIASLVLFPAAALADCKDLPDHGALQKALQESVKPSGGPSNGGFDLNMWATLVDRDGAVCQVAFSGKERGDQWPGSRVISAQKANTANAFSLDGLALSTANLFTAVQSGNSLFGLQASNPVDTAVAYGGKSEDYGTDKDPMDGRKIGGVNVFGGGFALYKEGKAIGALGVSGDSSCADHNIGWRVRKALSLDTIPAGVSANKDDGIVYDIDSAGVSKSGWGHPTCGGTEPDVALSLGAGNK
jgi:uncharacterized protein GlcG (DUF336 family)